MTVAAADLAEVQATREAIGHQLADATTAIRDAAARETELDAQLQQERMTRAALEQTVADAESALRDAQQRHEAALTVAAADLAKVQATREAIGHQLADATTAIARRRRARNRTGRTAPAGAHDARRARPDSCPH